MALIKCPECGKEISNKAVACPHCGCPASEWSDKNIENKETKQSNSEKEVLSKILHKYDERNKIKAIKEIRELTGYDLKEASKIANDYYNSLKKLKPTALKPSYNYNAETTRIMCTKCGSTNIQINLISQNTEIQGKSEIRKKSIATRAGNSAGRGLMIAMTGGLWALTPKQSKYQEINNSKIVTTTQKICVCQNCGYSWNI